MGMMGLGPLGMLNAPPPPMNIRPGNMNNIGGIPGLGGPRPGLPGIRPMNMGPQVLQCVFLFLFIFMSSVLGQQMSTVNY